MPWVYSAVLFSLLLLMVPFPLLAAGHDGHSHHSMKAAEQSVHHPDFALMPGPGEKVPLANGGYLIFDFDRTPKIGTVILKVQMYAADGQRDTSLRVVVDCGMPSMRGAHETGDQPMQLSNKGDYLIPLNLVMPGDWEVRLTVVEGDKTFFRGRYLFDI